MKQLWSQCGEVLATLLSFLGRRATRDSKEPMEFIRTQYLFMVDMMEKFQKDYYASSERIREMHDRIIRLGSQLEEALQLRCMVRECPERSPEEEPS